MSEVKSFNINGQEYDISSNAVVDSSNNVLVYDDNSTANLNIGDENGNVLVQFKDGHIKTQNFDSRDVNTDSSTISTTTNEYYKHLISCFERIVCIGDSITAGYTGSLFTGTNISSNSARITARNWPAYFKRITHTDVINLGYGSSATTHWRNSTPETQTSNLYCCLDLANIEGTQAYFIMLGWNDSITVGSSSDIQTSYDDNAVSFYGNYDNIVRRLHEYQPKAHIFLFTLARSKSQSSYNGAIRYIADLYSDYCHLIDYSTNTFFNTTFFTNAADGTHYTPLSYNAFAVFVRDLVSEYMYNNPNKFKGIPYTSTNQNIDNQELRLSSSDIKIEYVGGYSTIIAEIIPNTATIKTITWEVISGDDIITIIPNQTTMYCTVKGIKSGTAVIRATNTNGDSKTCSVSVAVSDIRVSNLTLDKTSVSISISSSEATVTATVYPTDATNKNVIWTLKSQTNDVATIEATGLECLVTPRNISTDTIIATTEDGNYTKECMINVTE